MGKFFNEKVYKDESKLSKIIIIGAISLSVILLVVILAIVIKNNLKSEILVKSRLDVELNDKLPSKKDFFEKLKNYNEEEITIDYDAINISTIGQYLVKVDTVKDGSNIVLVVVSDTTAPDLILKDVSINSKETYNINDFIESCMDNSKEECQVSYYNALDEEGNAIDFASFKEDGTYTVRIIAEDKFGNVTQIKDATLTIGNKENTNYGQDCTYGNLDPNNEDIPLAVNVGNLNTGCAINRDLWDNEDLLKTVNDFATKDYVKLKKDMQEYLNEKYPNGANIVPKIHFVNIYNKTLTGLIGYAIYVDVYVSDSKVTSNIDNDKYLVLSYYVKSDSTREYKTNKANLAN